MSNRSKLIVVSFLFLIGQVHGITPMDYYNSLVAGGNDAGFKDGAFYEARFRQPAGLAIDGTGTKLYVADSNNHRIRLVYLNENNRVETFAGTGLMGKADGPLAQASFNTPTFLTFLPGDRLAVNDEGNGLIRIIDLKSQRVTTLGAATGIRYMVYHPKEDCLYLTQFDGSALLKMDLKSAAISVIFINNPLVPHPQAICMDKDQMYLADRDLPLVYRVEAVATTTSAQLPVTLIEAGKGDRILQMVASEGILYALQLGENPVARVVPNYKPVSLATAWGFMVENQNPGVEAFLQFNQASLSGFASSPAESHKFFISSPFTGFNSIYSVKDYDFDLYWGSYSHLGDPTINSDFNYPKKKPPKTYRILVTGDSKAYSAPDLGEGTTHSRMVLTYTKQLEFMLNTQAALDGVDTHFEVLNMGRGGSSICSYLYDDAPILIDKYDIDMVLGAAHMSSFMDYFANPMRPLGIPSRGIFPEYLLQPAASRIPPGAPEILYQRAKAKGLLQDGLPMNVFGSYLGDEAARKALMEMDGKSLKLFNEKLQTMKTKEGTTPKFLAFFAPTRFFDNNDLVESYWKDVCSQNGISFLDLAPAYNALKTSFYPNNEDCCSRHYLSYGNTLVAYLLTQYMIDQKWIPYEDSSTIIGQANK